MKKCINCGREIPDDAVFCGFCGTRQPETENKEEPEKETVEEISPASSEENEDKDVNESETSEELNASEKEETGEGDSGSDTEDNVTDPDDEGSSDSEQETVSETEVVDTPEPEESDDSDIKDAEIVEPSEEKDSEESDTSEKKEDAEDKDAENADHSESNYADDSESEEKESENNDSASKEEESSSEKKIHKPHIQMKKIELPKINLSRDDFSVLIDIIENPVEHHGITNATTWIILIFAWIANWVAFGSFSAGFFTLLIVLIGLIFLNWLTLKDHATFGETVRNSAEVIFTPSLLVFAGGLFIRNITAGAEVFAFHSIFTTAFIGLFFLTAALILYLYIVIKKYEMKIWQFVLILTIFTSLLFWYLMTSGVFALIA